MGSGGAPRATAKKALTRLEEGLLLSIPVRERPDKMLERLHHHRHRRGIGCTRRLLHLLQHQLLSDLYFIFRQQP